MNADRFAEIERLYHQAMIRRPEERAAFLNQACADDDALRREVQSLLSLQTGADEFLSRPAIEEAARSSQRFWEPDSWPTIPGYTVVRVLGEGGMGVVYLAEQETPFRRLVALKLIKPGMDTRQVVARFETERQALALMDHPNIAAVFDAGSTDEGRPYFVMEFVDGIAITDYCDRGRLSTRDRLALFVQVCAAVQHAHQKGVIHRDLKPSNVLVAERDGHALPKVIDFGTAKAIGGTWNATATQGGQGMVLGTLEYMSPEQAALSGDIDTATDVYSLGVLLYELLVGRLPFDTDELRAAGYDEIRRVIRESEPPKPSVRAEQRSDMSGPAARARQTDAPGLTRQLKGDLDWITLKALEKDRRRRYATVAALATDIGRFLGDQPVEARPPSSTYRIRKFTRRHRLAVWSAATILTILSAGGAATAGLYWQVSAALRESTYLAYTATLAAAAGDLSNDAAPEAQARLLKIPAANRGWEWQHLFIQSDESLFTLASANPCPWAPRLSLTTALSLDGDDESIVLRRCATLERWNVTTHARTSWSAPSSRGILAENAGGLVLILATPPITEPRAYRLVLTDRAGSIAKAFGPFGRIPKCAAISPDGTRIALGLAEGVNPAHEDVFEVWNAATGRLESRLAAEPPALLDIGYGGRACVMKFSPDGRQLATSGATVHVWDTESGAKRAGDSFQAGTYPQAIQFSPRGDRLAIGRSSGLVDVLYLGPPSPILRRLSANGLDGEESVPEGDRTVHFLQRRHEVLAVAFSPDGQTVVSGSSTTIGIWDIGQSKLVRVLCGHTAEVIDVAVSFDGHRIYSVDSSGVVRAWPLSSTPAIVRTLSSFGNVLAFGASADGRVIATETSDRALTAIRLSDLHQEVIKAGTGQASETVDLAAIAVSPDSLRVFGAEFDGSIRRWTIGTDETVASGRRPNVNCPGSSSWPALTVSPNGSLLASSDNNCVYVWDASTMKQLAVFVVPGASPTNLLFRDEGTLIIASVDRARRTPSLIRLWNWRTQRVLATVQPKPTFGAESVSSLLAVSLDGRRIALASSTFQTPTTVSIWNADLNAQVGTLPPGDFRALAFSPDGRRVVSVGAKESAVRVWDAERLVLLLTLPDTDSHRGGVIFTRAGQIVAGRTGGGLTIWDTKIRQR